MQGWGDGDPGVFPRALEDNQLPGKELAVWLEKAPGILGGRVRYTGPLLGQA